MTLRTKLFIAGGLAGVGLIVLIVALVGTGGVRGYLDDKYKRVSGSGNSVVYTSTSKPKAVYEEIRSARPPADTQVDPSGYFMRYSDDIVAVTADGSGSRIYVDDERRGYSHWIFFVGGVWGTGGPGDNFRGGGPGGGK
jgi:uncharacterized protein DUF4247